MKGINNIIGAEETVGRLAHMYNHCAYRFEMEIGCEGCAYNISDNDEIDVDHVKCVLLQVSDSIRKCTTQSDATTCLVGKIKR